MSNLAQLHAYEESALLPQFFRGIRIETGPVPSTLDGETHNGVLWHAAPGQFLLRVPEVAVFHVQGGHTITIEREPKTDDITVQRFTRMSPLAALFYQRGTLAFHAAAAANSNGAILLAGDSGTGKSTLLTALLSRGWTMLADELAVVNLDESGTPRIPPAFPQVRLRQSAAEKLRLSPTGWGHDESNWRVVSAIHQFSLTSQPLHAIYWLTVHNVERIEQHELEGMERYRAVGMLTYNSHIADALLDRAEYLRQASAIAQTVPIRRLYRPRGKWVVEELADQIETACA